MNPDGPGALVLVSTPIGNLGDLSPRAIEELGGADIVCCEDTRHSRRLLDHAGLHPARLIAVHTHNEAEQATRLVGEMAAGARVAYVTDAGTPGISDPGARLVAAAVEAGIEVLSVPGPTALIAALVVSGLPTERFCFEGFLPRKGRDRTRRLAALAVETRTTVLHESPHRLAATLADLVGACGGDRRVALARELTKRFEEVWRGTLAGAVERAATVEARGEYVLVVDGAPDPEPATEDDVVATLLRLLAEGSTRRERGGAGGRRPRRAPSSGLQPRRRPRPTRGQSVDDVNERRHGAHTPRSRYRMRSGVSSPQKTHPGASFRNTMASPSTEISMASPDWMPWSRRSSIGKTMRPRSSTFLAIPVSFNSGRLPSPRR